MKNFLRCKSVGGGLMQLLDDYCQKHQIISPVERKYHIDERVTFGHWLKCLQQIYMKRPIAGLGIEIGSGIQPQHVGVNAYIAQSCQNLEQYFSMSTDYINIWYNFTPLILEWQADQVVICWEQPAYVQTGMYVLETAISQDIILSIILHRMRALVGADQVSLNGIELTIAQPAKSNVYDLFRCPIRYGQPQAKIMIPRSILKLPLKASDSFLLDILIKQADLSLSKVPESNSIIEQINLKIIESIKIQRTNVDWVASALNMSSRQLQKTLKEHDLSFTSCLNNVRYELAKQYLNDSELSVLDVALMLSYNEPASFNRAFKSWSGLNPSQWRQQQIHMPSLDLPSPVLQS